MKIIFVEQSGSNKIEEMTHVPRVGDQIMLHHRINGEKVFVNRKITAICWLANRIDGVPSDIDVWASIE